MNNCLKIEFNSEDDFIIYYICEDSFENEDDYRILFKYLNDELYKRFDYTFEGFYDVYIYTKKGIYIFEFNRIDDYGRKDFNVTLFQNSNILYKFEDIDLVAGNKAYYKGYFYVEIEDVLDDIRLFEYGSIVYGKEVNEVLNKGLLLT